MALLASIVRKEALLPVHTAASAATHLLPVIYNAAIAGLVATKPDDPAPPDVCKELLVSANVTPIEPLQAGFLHVCNLQQLYPTTLGPLLQVDAFHVQAVHGVPLFCR